MQVDYPQFTLNLQSKHTHLTTCSQDDYSIEVCLLSFLLPAFAYFCQVITASLTTLLESLRLTGPIIACNQVLAKLWGFVPTISFDSFCAKLGTFTQAYDRSLNRL